MPLFNSTAHVQWSKRLFWLNTAVWLTLTIFSIGRIGGDAPGGPVTLWIITILMLGNAAAFLWCSWAVQKQNRLYHFIIIAILGANIFLTFTDEFGLMDLLTLLLDLALLALVLSDFRKFST